MEDTISSLVVNGGGVIAYGTASPGLPWLTTRYVPITIGKWFHVAVVWDDDWAGYSLYIDGQQADRLKSNGVLPDILYERIHIGSDGTDAGGGWAGGIAWWRGFDYRLSTDQIAMDRDDNWANLI